MAGPSSPLSSARTVGAALAAEKGPFAARPQPTRSPGAAASVATSSEIRARCTTKVRAVRSARTTATGTGRAKQTIRLRAPPNLASAIRPGLIPWDRAKHAAARTLVQTARRAQASFHRPGGRALRSPVTGMEAVTALARPVAVALVNVWRTGREKDVGPSSVRKAASMATVSLIRTRPGPVPHARAIKAGQERTVATQNVRFLRRPRCLDVSTGHAASTRGGRTVTVTLDGATSGAPQLSVLRAALPGRVSALHQTTARALRGTTALTAATPSARPPASRARVTARAQTTAHAAPTTKGRHAKSPTPPAATRPSAGMHRPRAVSVASGRVVTVCLVHRSWVARTIHTRVETVTAREDAAMRAVTAQKTIQHS